MTDRVPPRTPPQTKTARMARDRLRRSLIGLDGDGALWRGLQTRVPEAWATLEDDLDVAEPREKLTLYLDRTVARFYRAMGAGYQARINRILSTYAQMKIGEVAREAEVAVSAAERYGALLPPDLRDEMLAGLAGMEDLAPHLRAAAQAAVDARAAEKEDEDTG